MASTQLTILQKNGMFSFLGLIQAHQLSLESVDTLDAGEWKETSAVVKLDPREGQPLLKQFDTNREAVHKYQDAINTSVERGWEVVFRGAPIYG